VLKPRLGTSYGRGVDDPMLGTVDGAYARGVLSPMLGTVWGGGGKLCARAGTAVPSPVTMSATSTPLVRAVTLVHPAPRCLTEPRTFSMMGVCHVGALSFGGLEK
jgi:hypothetical protein